MIIPYVSNKLDRVNLVHSILCFGLLFVVSSASAFNSHNHNDTIPPVFEVLPSNITVECNGEGNIAELQAWLNTQGGAQVSVSCEGPLTWQNLLLDEESTCGQTKVKTYRFIATDVCDNTSFEEAQFITEDHTPPVLNGGSSLIYQCSQEVEETELIFWLGANAYMGAADACDNISWSNDFDLDNWVETCSNTRYIDVSFTATDGCGNSSTETFRFGSQDNQGPEFINCDRPPIVAVAPNGWCEAFVNFSPVLATDNCGELSISQTDGLGLASGSLFPLGLTTLTYEAVDVCSNISTCELKIIVNDNLELPLFNCPGEVIVDSDPGECGAFLDGLAPNEITDNCTDLLAVTYKIYNEFFEEVETGISGADQVLLPPGDNYIDYKIQDQPILLITEVKQNPSFSGVEITNFGPASLDISSLKIETNGVIGNTSTLVPTGTILEVGGIYTWQTSGSLLSSPNSYALWFEDRFIDGVAVNGMLPDDFEWEGNIFSGHIYRSKIFDTNSSSDWLDAKACEFTGFGLFNSGLQTYEDNGFLTSLQSKAPNVNECSFLVHVNDAETPFCAEYDTSQYSTGALPITIKSKDCSTSFINVFESFTVGDVNVSKLMGFITELGEISMALTSPKGTKVYLFDGICEGFTGFTLKFDDEAEQPIDSIGCLNQNDLNTYQPIGSLKDFYGEDAYGSWTLEIYSKSNIDGQLADWNIEILELVPYSQETINTVSDSNSCHAVVSWTHPLIEDNCYAGTLSVNYTSENDILLPSSGEIVPGSQATEQFEVGRTTVQYTIVDIGGRTSMSTFDIIVHDNQFPELIQNSCGDFSVVLPPRECISHVDLAEPVVLDNCNDFEYNYSPDPTLGLEVGIHEILLTVTDIGGNAVSCTLNYYVFENSPSSNSIECSDTLTVYLGPNCEKIISPEVVLSDDETGCIANYIVLLEDGSGQLIGTSEEGTNIVDYQSIGEEINITICSTDPINGSCCTSSLVVEPEVDPELICPVDVTIICDESNSPDILGYPQLISCNQELDISYTDEFEDFGQCVNPRASITRNWIIEDNSGNIYECQQSISISDLELDFIVFPQDIIAADALDCQAVAADTNLLNPETTGYPYLNNMEITGDDGLCMVSLEYSDEISFTCRGSYEIMRSWTIQDMCDADSMEIPTISHTQLITVADTQGPDITGCPDDITVSTDPWGCLASMDLDELVPDVFDACGGIQEIQVFVGKGSVIQNPDNPLDISLANLDVGLHELRLTAKDFCGNFNTCEFDIHVVDGVAPVADCLEEIVVNLDANGSFTLFANNLDEGFYDNCDPVLTQIYRPQYNCSEDDFTQPGQFVKFCCEDVANSELTAVLRVWDDADDDNSFGTSGDNFTDCVFDVIVEEMAPPGFVCRPDMTLNCSDNVWRLFDGSALEITQEPFVQSTCGMTNIEYVATGSLDDCGNGEVYLIWSAIDSKGEDRNCVQTIVVQPNDNQILTCDKIRFPEGSLESEIYGDEFWCLTPEDSVNYSPVQITDCVNLAFTPPMIDNSDLCSSFSITYTSDTSDFVVGACKKIYVLWQIVDECHFDEGFGDTINGMNDPFVAENGYFEYMIVYDVSDYGSPEITCGTDILIPCGSTFEGPFVASAIDNCNSPDEFFWSWQIDLFNDGEMEGFGFTDEIQASYLDLDAFEPGQHKITWNVNDGCGNQRSEPCIINILEDDEEGPTALCTIETTANLQEDGTVQLLASDFDGGSFDNCTDVDELIFSSSGTQLSAFYDFDCSYLPNGISEELELELFVWDHLGNTSSCITTLILRDLVDICSDGAEDFARIAGTVFTESGSFVPQTRVTLNSTHPEYPDIDYTNDNGAYAFEENPFYYQYEINPSKITGILEGVSTLDLVLIQKHILGFAFLNSPYKIIAADINNDEKISAIDLVLLRKLILGIEQFNTHNDSWRFVDTEYVFPDESKPFPFKENRIIEILEDHSIHNDFFGVKIGDVNASYSPGLNSGVQVRSEEVILEVAKEQISNGQVRLDFYVSQEQILAGAQFTIDLAGSELTEIVAGQLPLTISNYNLSYAEEKGLIPFSWNHAAGLNLDTKSPLFSIILKNYRDQLEINSKLITNEIYLGELLEIGTLKLQPRNKEKIAFELLQNVPNPFSESTVIRFIAPEKGIYNIVITDITGIVIYSNSMNANKGMNELMIDQGDIGVPGLFYYTVGNSKFTSTMSFIAF